MVAASALPAPGTSATHLLDGPAGAIETLVAAPATTVPRGVALICHPHPLHGGALTNKVAYTLAAAALGSGLVAARFNFRGVGRSGGRHDDGRGETDDTVFVADWLRRQVPGAQLLLAGFSFGAFVSLKAAARAAPAALVSIAPPLRLLPAEPLPPRPAAPWLVVHGRDDDVVPFAQMQTALAGYSPPPELVALDGVGHFFHGRLAELQTVVAGFIATHWRA